jgi:hypothetical protein
MYGKTAHLEPINIQMRLPLEGLQPPIIVKYTNNANTKQRFWEFHRANPQVLRALVSLTKWFRDEHGIEKMSIKLPYEWLRWGYFIHTQGRESYILNNSFSPYYSRLIMQEFPELKGVFELRAVKR